MSLYDEFGPGLTLAVRGEPTDVKSFEAAAQALTIPLATLAIPETAASLFPCAMTLIRPDQHVVWTGDTADESLAEQVLRIVSAKPALMENLRR